MAIHLDTHVVAWLYFGQLTALSSEVRRRIEQEDLVISPIVTLELQYLCEIGRTTVPGEKVVNTLAEAIGVRSSTLPFSQVVVAALEESWTRDPFDRLIVSQARIEAAQLVSKDRDIRKNYADALW